MSQFLLANPVLIEALIPLSIMVALVAGGAFLIIYSARMRAQAVARRVEGVQTSLKGSQSLRARRVSPEEYRFKPLTQGLSVQEQQHIARVLLKLKVSPEWAVAYFTGFRLILVVTVFATVFATISSSSKMIPILAAASVAMIAWYVPLVLVKRGLKRHRKEVGSALPDALELLAICVDAGISLEGGLKRIGDELAESQPALASELRLTWAEISLLPSVDQALYNMAQRIDLPSLRSVVGTLAQSMRLGTPLAHSLRVAASEMRNDQLVQLEERANRLPALLTVPVMLLIMPTIFLIVGGPAALRVMDVFGRGH